MVYDRIAIVGTGLIGASIGLGIKAARPSTRITGFDTSFDNARTAQRLKAIDRVAALPDAVSGADLVVLATPVGAMPELLAAMAPELKSGAVVMDTGGSKADVLQAAAESLGAGPSFVGTDPMAGKAFAGPEGADVALFRGSVWCVCPSTTAQPAAVDGVVALVESLGAVAYFLDAGEHDGLTASVNQLPMLLASILVQHLADAPGWRETAAVASTSFGYATQLTEHNPQAVASAVLANRENVARRLDLFVEALERVRTMVAVGDPGLAALLENAQTRHGEWLSGRAAHPDRGEGQAIPSSGAMLSSTFLGGLGRNRGERGDRDQQGNQPPGR